MQPTTSPQDELTLRDLVLKVEDYVREIFRYKWIVLIAMVLGLAYQAFIYFNYEPLYHATITFSVDEDEGGSSSGLTGILGQFGLGGVRPTRYNLDKIMALSKSRRVIQQTLFAKITMEGKEDYLANHLIRHYDLDSAFVFTHDSIPMFSRDENKRLLALYGFIIGPENNPKKALANADYNDDTNIMSISVSTTHETLSRELAQHMFESLSGYYVSKSIEKQVTTYTVVAAKRDSVLAELKAAEYQLANFRDTHRGLLMRTDQLTDLRLQREIVALTAMYQEVLKNTEVASFSLRTKTPFIQVIDAPANPIEPASLSLWRKAIIGLVLGGVIGAALIAGRKLFRDAMKPAPGA
jgi:hypothetical protein